MWPSSFNLPLVFLVAGVLSCQVVRAQDACYNDNKFLAQIDWRLSCAMMVGVFPGTPLTCEPNGIGSLVCPLACGLCDELAAPPKCTEEEIRSHKADLLVALQDLGVCEDCEVPDNNTEAIYIVNPPSAMVSAPFSTWTSTNPRDPCTLSGVTCDRCGEARDVATSYPQPASIKHLAPSIFKLRRLETLNVQRIGGTDADAPYLPGSGWRQLQNLTILYLGGAARGDVPELYDHPNLVTTRLVDTDLRGDANMLIGSAEQLVLITSQQFFPWAKEAPLTERVCRMQKLSFGGFYDFMLTGTLPSCLRFPKLVHLGFKRNFLTGDASALFEAQQNEALRLSGGNKFTGTIPASLSKMTVLGLLELEGNLFSGTLPDLSQFSDLTLLDVSGNLLTGASSIAGNELAVSFAGNLLTAFPTAWMNLPGVRVLDVSENQIGHWPPAGMIPRGVVLESGIFVDCHVQRLMERFNWPQMEKVVLNNNPLNQDVREVLGSLAGLPLIGHVEASHCGLMMDLPNEGSDRMLVQHADGEFCSGFPWPGFRSLRVLRIPHNNITAFRGGLWDIINTLDISENNLEYIDEDWIGPEAPFFQDFRGNPRLHLPVLPPREGGFCSEEDLDLRADGRGYMASLGGESYECTLPCSTRSLLYVSGSVNFSSLCRCSPGWYGEGSNCMECGPDEWSSAGATSPSKCPGNSSTLGAVRQTNLEACDCNAGFYRAYLPAMQCIQCPANHIREVAGARSLQDCLACPAGRFSNPGALTCEECPIGTVSTGGAGSGCSACEVGTYADSIGATLCAKCELGSYQPEEGRTACIPCEGEGNHTWEFSESLGRFLELTGARTEASCGCATGRRPVGGVCVQCGFGVNEGLRCPGGLGEVVEVLPGYYSEEAISMFRCWGDQDRCIGGPPGQTCNSGRYGLTCTFCPAGRAPMDGGKCRPCSAGAKSLLPVAAGILLLVAVIVYRSVDTDERAKQTATKMLIFSVFSIVVSSAQQLGVLFNIGVDWAGPVRWMLATMQLLNFDIEVLKVDCVTTVKPVNLFTTRVVMIIVCVVVIFMIHIVSVIVNHGGRFRQKQATLICCLGIVATLFYVAIVTTVTGPLQCQSHPNGRWTSRAYPGVVCWESDEHATMVWISVAALTVPAGYLAGVAQVVRIYPREVNRGNVQFVNSYRFLFSRFNASSYWYVLMPTLRGLLLALSVLLPSAALAIFMMQTLLLFAVVVAALALPWRVRMASALDIIFTAALMLLFSAAAFFASDVEASESRMAISWACTMAIVTTLVVVPFVVIGGLLYWFVFTRAGGRTFEFFLCHHKAGAGAFTRLVKLQLLESGQPNARQVFVDSDNLANLDRLFSHIVEETDVIVAVASRELLLRPWCVGELTTARLNGRLVLPVHMPDYVPLDDKVIMEYPSHVDITALVERGISAEMVQDTLAGFWPALHCIVMPAQLNRCILRDLSRVLRLKSLTGRTLIQDKGTEAGCELRPIIICSDCSNLEAVATAFVLEKMIQPLILEESDGTMLYNLPSGSKPPDDSDRAIFLCSGGCLESEAFVDVLCVSSHLNLPALPIIVQEAFRFPSADRLQQALLGDRKSLDKVRIYIMGMFKEIAPSFLAQYASETSLRTTAMAIAQRLPQARQGRRASGQTPKFAINKNSGGYSFSKAIKIKKMASNTSMKTSSTWKSEKSIASEKSVSVVEIEDDIASDSDRHGQECAALAQRTLDDDPEELEKLPSDLEDDSEVPDVFTYV